VTSGWRPVLSGAEAARALDVARQVGERLRDPRLLQHAIDAPPRQGMRGYGAWNPIGLARGRPGLALTFAHLAAAFPDDGWENDAHREVVLAVQALRDERYARTGLADGLAGLAFSVHTIDQSRYARVLATLDGLIERRTQVALASFEADGRGSAREDVDVVSGLAGVGAQLLTRGQIDALRPVLDRLVRLVAADGHAPAWHTPAEHLLGELLDDYPDGLLDCGLAHGLPGMLALLSLARAAGVDVSGLDEAIETGAGWLREHAIEDDWGVNWPYFVPLGRGRDRGPARAGWCYGAPGVARALWLAGDAAADERIRTLAVDALEAVHRRPLEERHIDAPTLCHVVGALLQITLRAAADAGDGRLRTASAELATGLIDSFDPSSVFGYRDLDPDGAWVDRAGVLEGAAGVVLVLLAAATESPPVWDRMLLVA